MSQLDIQRHIANPRHTFHAFLLWLWQAMGDIYLNPFRVSALTNGADLEEHIEQQRRVFLFRLIVLSYTAGLLLFALGLFVFSHASPFFRVADLAVVCLNIGCFVLSYYRWSTVATIIFLLTSLAFCLVLIEHDIEMLNPRSLVIYSLISLLILMAGILLPHNLVWIVIPVMIVVTSISMTMLPTQMTDPRGVIIGALLTQYAVAVLVTWLYVRSTSLRVKTLGADLAYEQELQQQKDAFINIAAHELRTPMTTLLLDCRLIEKYLHQPERAEQVMTLTGDMSRHVKRMDSMTTMLLDAARVSLDQFTLRKESCDIAACIRSAVEEQEQISARHIEMQGVAEPIAGMVDGGRIWQVMTNLVGNALKFSTTSDEVKVTVAVIQRELARFLHVEVSDTGPGIPPQVLPHLFVRNYRARDDNEEHQAGLGLGLYISSTIITLHGGAIWVDSTLGQGSTFLFDLPLG